MNAFRKCWSLTLMPLVFGLIAWVGAAPTPKGSTGRIVFEHAPDDSAPYPTSGIYSVNADGTQLRALTADGHSHGPNWSPDGRHILYIHDTYWPSRLPKPDIRIDDKQWLSHLFNELYVMDSHGGNAHLLRQLDGPIQAAAWSPDGKTLAFEGTEPGPDGEPADGLFLIPAHGQGEPRLLFRRASQPAWSPGSNKLAFVVRAAKNVYDGDWAIAVGDADGSHEIQLTDPDHIQRALFPAWSPDGKQIAFDAFDVRRPGGVSDQEQVFVMRADGSDIRQLTTDPKWACLHPTWSPDGTEIAFFCRSEAAPCSAGGESGLGFPGRGCVRRIFVMSLSDPNAKPTQITQHDGANPVFAPVP
jgi:Tol biopolymer transport system component